MAVDELAQQSPPVSFEVLTLIRVGVLRAAGFRLEPTGRNPRHFTVAFDDLEMGIEALRRSEHRSWADPYHEGRSWSKARGRWTDPKRGDLMSDLDLVAERLLGVAADVLRSFGSAFGGQHIAIVGGAAPTLLVAAPPTGWTRTSGPPTSTSTCRCTSSTARRPTTTTHIIEAYGPSATTTTAKATGR